MDYIIETENLTKRYGTATVVDKVNLHVPKGKIYGLLGRNGAGKTTAMKMMLQLAFPTEGTVRLFGTNYKENIHTLYSKVGSIIETPGFYSNLTGYENLQILAKLRGGVSKSGVEKALEVVGLHKEKRKVFSDYSLGMKQRLGIAAAIMHEPELLILDEPINYRSRRFLRHRQRQQDAGQVRAQRLECCKKRKGRRSYCAGVPADAGVQGH